MDTAAVWAASSLFGDSNSASRLRHHSGSVVLQKSGVSILNGSCCMEVRVQNLAIRWQKSTTDSPF